MKKQHVLPLQPSRRGTVIIIAMVAIIMTSSVLLTLVKTGLTQYQQTKREQLRIQADWLAEAGLERAFNKMQTDKKYTGETWQIPAKDLSGQQAGSVLITTEKNSQIKVKAIFPAEGIDRAVVTRTITIKQ